MDKFNFLLEYYQKKPYKKELEYIESTGTQYINADIIPDFANGDSIEIHYYGQSYSGVSPCIFGSRESGVLNGVYVLGSGTIIADSEGYSNVPVKSLIGEHIISINDLSITVDESYYTMPRHVTCGLPIFLFALNNYGTGTYGIYSGMKLYEWKYWHNGVLTQHLIPVLDNNNIPCMYDKISNQLFYNQGTGQFLYGQIKYLRKLQYLESTGTQYIDTGVSPDLVNGDSIEIKFFGIYMESGAKSVFGSRNMSSAKVVNGLYINGVNIAFGDSEGYTTIPFDYRNEHILTINDNEVIDNGSLFAQTPKHITCDYPIYLFTLNDRNFQTIGTYDGMKLYEWKYYQNGVLAQHLIPVLDNNNVPCMYDNVSNQLFYNAGTGQFNYA